MGSLQPGSGGTIGLAAATAQTMIGPAISSRSPEPLAIGRKAEADVLVLDPFAALIHDAGFQHRGGAGPVQIDPARDIGLRHAAAAADALGHLAGQRFDVRSGHAIIIGAACGCDAGYTGTWPTAWRPCVIEWLPDRRGP